MMILSQKGSTGRKSMVRICLGQFSTRCRFQVNFVLNIMNFESMNFALKMMNSLLVDPLPLPGRGGRSCRGAGGSDLAFVLTPDGSEPC